MPKVSAIIPVYNTERYLTQCLESVVSQTLDDIEIICVNDGSTDRSADILSEYARRDSRVAVVNQSNQGLSAARNAGVSAATGDYIYFLDSDDFIELDALEGLCEEASSNDLDVLYFDAVPFFEDSALEVENSGYKSYYTRSMPYPDVLSGPELLAAMAENNDYKPSACLQLIRRAYYEAAELTFYVGILHEDHLFSLKCALQAGRARHIVRPYYRRRIREGSIMTDERGAAANFKGFFISYLEMLRFAIRNDYDEKTSAAIAKLCLEVHQAALKVLREMPDQELDSVAHLSTSPEALITYELLVRQRRDARKIGRLEKALGARTRQLETIRNSRLHLAMQRLRSLLGRKR